METCGVPADALTWSLALIFGITRFLPSLPKEPAGASIHIIEVSCFVFVLFIYLFILAVLVFHCCVGFSPAVASRGPSLAAVLGLLVAVASLVTEHRLQGAGCQ